MTEKEWAQSTDPLAMLRLCADTLFPVSCDPGISKWLNSRRQRLLVCALARQKWADLANECRHRVILGEWYVDGDVNQDALLVRYRQEEVSRTTLAYWVADPSVNAHILQWTLRTASDCLTDPEYTHVIRDVFGKNPPGCLYFPEICQQCNGYGWQGSLEDRYDRCSCSSCLGCGYLLPRWRNQEIQEIAHAAYKQRTDIGQLNKSHLSILADALEDAGCPESQEQVCLECEGTGSVLVNSPDYSIEYALGYEQVKVGCVHCHGDYGSKPGRGYVLAPHPFLSHLRNQQVHYPGCWAVDMLRSCTKVDPKIGSW